MYYLIEMVNGDIQRLIGPGTWDQCQDLLTKFAKEKSCTLDTLDDGFICNETYEANTLSADSFEDFGL